MKQAVKLLLSVALAAVLLWFAFRSVDWNSFMNDLALTRWVWVVLFVAASLMALLFRTLRWEALLSSPDNKASKRTIWNAANVGNLANTVLPGSGEFVRCGYLTSPGRPYEKVFGTIVSERIFDLIAIGVLLILALTFGWGRYGDFFLVNIWQPLSEKASVPLWGIGLAVLLAGAAFIYLTFRFREKNRVCGKIASLLSGLAEGLASISRIRHKWLFIAYTIGIWGMYILMCYSMLLAVPALSNLRFTDAIFITAVGNFASVIPVPGGIGAYHYIVALILSSLYGATWDTGILYATLNHELHAVLIILLGIISYSSLTIRSKK